MKVRIIENKLTDIKAKIIDLKSDIYEKYHVTTNLTYEDDYLSIEHIENENVEKNINGYRAMVEIIAFADAHKLPIGLIASEFYGTTIDKLRKFYEGFGFVKTHIYEPGVEFMQRKPKTINKSMRNK
jgi:hypothetical protein